MGSQFASSSRGSYHPKNERIRGTSISSNPCCPRPVSSEKTAVDYRAGPFLSLTAPIPARSPKPPSGTPLAIQENKQQPSEAVEKILPNSSSAFGRSEPRAELRRNNTKSHHSKSLKVSIEGELLLLPVRHHSCLLILADPLLEKVRLSLKQKQDIG